MGFSEGFPEGQVRDIVEAVVKDNFLELFELRLRPQGKKLVLTVVLDKRSGPITLDECTAVSRELEKRLDELNLIESSYLLEVTSPGLDRRLRDLADCERFKGQLAHVVLHEPIGNQTDFRGRLGEVKDGQVELLADGGKQVWLRFTTVKRANLVVEI